MIRQQQKRFRSTNWDEDEKQIFRSVIKDYSEIIECKRLDTNTNNLKIMAWEEVYTKFNERNRRRRELGQLKIQWKLMKLKARNTIRNIKKEANNTRPPTPDNVVKNILNPAEIIRDNNVYDSDRIIPSTSSLCETIFKEEPELLTVVKVEVEENGRDNIEDYNGLADIQESTPILVPQYNATSATSINETTANEPEKISEEYLNVPTFKKTNDQVCTRRINNKMPKRKIPYYNMENGLMSRKNDEDYVNGMLSHSKMLKEVEHVRRMEMAEEEHAILMEIHRERLKCAVLERQILENQLNNVGLEPHT